MARKLDPHTATLVEKCPKCGCKFIIEPGDIHTIEKAPEVQYVSCPDCEHMVGVHITREDIVLSLIELYPASATITVR